MSFKGRIMRTIKYAEVRGKYVKVCPNCAHEE
jgi:hypothetical protein